MDGISAGLGIVTGVLQLYSTLTTAYDLCLDIKHFPKSYHEFRMGLVIERKKLELWALSALSESEQQRVKESRSPSDWGLWKIFEAIFIQMLEAFEESHRKMESVGHQTGLPTQQDELEDWELLGSMSLAVKEPPKQTFMGVLRTGKFILRDKSKIKALIKKLRVWNENLNQMFSQMEQQRSQRRLRVLLSSGDLPELQILEAAAAMFDYPDLQSMAKARSMIEQANMMASPKALNMADVPTNPVFGFHLEMSELIWQDSPYKTDRPRAMASLRNDPVIVDWRTCADDTWRRKNPDAFHQRTEKLTQVLNSNMRPLNLSVLHCVGYLERNTNVTGYAFRLPQHAEAGQNPIHLEQLIKGCKKAEDIPDLGERFELAKALVSTIFEIHNLGWMHKNILPKNILFWPKADCKAEWDISRPYLMGWDIARPNQPGEVTEKPPPRPEEDIYRHPYYKGQNPHTFQPSFDMYSIGVILYEIGRWRRVTVPEVPQRPDTGERPSLVKILSDPQYIETLLENGSVRDLKRYTGAKYRDAVVACLQRDFDAVWEQEPPPQGAQERQEQLQTYLYHVQRTVVDTIALCNA